MNELRQVVEPLAQGRHRDDRHGEAEEEILAKLSGRDVGPEVPVRRRDDADIDSTLHLAANPAHLSALEGAQKAWLQVDGELSDLVEEERPTVSALERARVGGDGPGEGPALVPEELALREIRRYRAAVEHDERAAGPRTLFVQDVGDDVLARSRLSEESDGDVRLREPPQHVEHFEHRDGSGREPAEVADRLLMTTADDLRRGPAAVQVPSFRGRPSVARAARLPVLLRRWQRRPSSSGSDARSRPCSQRPYLSSRLGKLALGTLRASSTRPPSTHSDRDTVLLLRNKRRAVRCERAAPPSADSSRTHRPRERFSGAARPVPFPPTRSLIPAAPTVVCEPCETKATAIERPSPRSSRVRNRKSEWGHPETGEASRRAPGRQSTQPPVRVAWARDFRAFLAACRPETARVQRRRGHRMLSSICPTTRRR